MTDAAMWRSAFVTDMDADNSALASDALTTATISATPAEPALEGSPSAFNRSRGGIRQVLRGD